MENGLFISLLLLFYSTIVYSQNILVNGSFEDQNICTEYNQACSPAGWITYSFNQQITSNSYALGIPPKDGKRYIKVIVGHGAIKQARSYITTKLLCGLRKGHEYMVEYYYYSDCKSIDSIGVLFTSNNFLQETRKIEVLNASANFESKNRSIIKKDSIWSVGRFVYMATGNEIYFTIGLFKNEDLYCNEKLLSDNYKFLYLDNVRLTPLSANETLCGNSDSLKRILYSVKERHGLLQRFKQDSPKNDFRNTSTVLLQMDTLTLNDLCFKAGSAVLDAVGIYKLTSAFSKIKSRIVDSIRIEGHTDNIGQDSMNMKLSYDRAGAILKEIKIQVNSDIPITIVGYSYRKPVDTNLTTEGRSRNRRVEIFIYFR